MFKKPKVMLLVLAVIVALAFDLVYYIAHPFGLSITVPHISLAAEEVARLGPLKITNTLIASWVTMLVLIVIALLATRKMELVPRGLQNVVEFVIEMLYNQVKATAGKSAALIFPTIATLFLFIIVSNWMGLLPGYLSITWAVGGAEQGAEAAHRVHLLRSANTDLNTTLALAIVSVLMSQVYGVIVVGFPRYFMRFFAVRRYIAFFKGLAGRGPRQGVGSLFMGFIDIFIGVLELFDEFTKIMSFGFRLFGNIFAGEVLLGVMVFLLPFVASLPFLGLELFVGFIQAFVFAVLSTAFISQATAHHGDEAAKREHTEQPAAQPQMASSVS
ncbi:MAG TPA: FoF1 ATP synthase subunit a [Anaerolineae bacterium]|nr:FoF1 ATP synthase subunit a [Anaerolineae bacterium]HPL30497.1 FoF1 ATP synthase subunit a [Anaerolineae bacterium]